jgi:hypothetical protein
MDLQLKTINFMILICIFSDENDIQKNYSLSPAGAHRSSDMYRLMLCVFAVLMAGAFVSAQAPGAMPLRWPEPGGAISYNVSYTTHQLHTLGETTSTAKSLVKGKSSVESSSCRYRWRCNAFNVHYCYGPRADDH